MRNRTLACAVLLGACRSPVADERTHPDRAGDDSGTEAPVVQVADLEAEPHADIGAILVATWTQDTAATGHVEFRFDGGDWIAAPEAEHAEGANAALVLGAPFDTEVELRVVHGDVTSDSAWGTTGPLPASVPAPEILVSSPSRQDPTFDYVLTSLVGISATGDERGFWTVIFDREGRVVWARQSPEDRVALQPQPSRDGTTLLIDHGAFWTTFHAELSQVERITIDGATVALYDTPGLHHPFTELADHAIAWTARDGHDETIEVLEPDGRQATVWSCPEFHAEHDVDAYCGSNTIWWDEETDTFLYSSYSTNTVVEIDHATGSTLRWFGQIDGAWGFDPADAAFWWQHGAHLTEADTLLVSTRSAEEGEETVVREYALDDETQVLRQVWTFGEGEGIYAAQMGEAERLPGGNTLHNYGSTTRLREVTSEGEVVWDVSWTLGAFLGRSTPIADLYAFAP